MREIVTVDVSSFRGSIGGEHWYGRLAVRTKMTRETGPDGEERLVTRMGHGVEPHPHDRYELKRRIGTREAAYLNRKDGDDGFLRGGGLGPGDETTRFNDVPSILAAAVEVFPTLFDETDVLFHERHAYSGEYEVLVAPDEVRAAFETTKSPRGREDWLMANGYMVMEERTA
jgi:hypothetical protein